MNGLANCLYAICCPPDSPEQLKALATEIASNVELGGGGTYKGALMSPHTAVAAYILDTFDLAPKGSLQPFKDEIARLAREPRDKGDGKV